MLKRLAAFLLVLVLLPTVAAASDEPRKGVDDLSELSDEEILRQLGAEDRYIVVLKDESVLEFSQLIEDLNKREREEMLASEGLPRRLGKDEIPEEYTEKLEGQHADVLDTVDSSKIELKSEFFYTVNALAVDTDPKTAKRLEKHPDVESVYRVKVYRALLKESRPLIGLGSKKTVGTGNITNLTIESLHPYEPFSNHTANVSVENYTNVSIHFEALNVEAGFDYVYVQDKNNNTVFNFSGAMEDVWTPVAEAPLTVYLSSDDTIERYGYKIDQIASETQTTIEPSIGDGTGVRVAVIDTGIDYTHPALGGCTFETFSNGTCAKFAGGYDFINNDTDPRDTSEHGTHVAGTIAGDGLTYGIAPGARLYAYKVLTDFGGGTTDTVLGGVETAVDPNKDGNPSDHADVISMSLGFVGLGPDHALARAVNNAHDAGVVVVVAAGNEGPNFNTLRMPGNARKALTVGGSDKSDAIYTRSSKGPIYFNGEVWIKPDIVAPGVSITAPSWRHSYESLTGTSMATPHVSGAVAIVKQLHPDWNTDRLEAFVVSHSRDIGIPLLEGGAGRLDTRQFAAASLVPDNKTITIPSVRNSATPAIGVLNFGSSSVSTASAVKTYFVSANGTVPSTPLQEISFVRVSGPSTLNPGERGVFVLNITPNATDQTGIYVGLLQINQSNETLRIPFGFNYTGRDSDVTSTPLALSTSVISPAASLGVKDTVEISFTPSSPANGTIVYLVQVLEGSSVIWQADSSIPSGQRVAVVWEGKRLSGMPVPDGNYTVKASASSDNWALTKDIGNATIRADNTLPSITTFRRKDGSPIHQGDGLGADRFECTATDATAVTYMIAGLDTSSTGTRNATCVATDAGGNNVIANTTYTVDAKPPQSASTDSDDDDDNGGGGGGGGSRRATKTTTLGSRGETNVLANKPAIARVTGEGAPVREVEIVADRNIAGARVNVRKMDVRPFGVEELSEAALLTYLEIEPVGLRSSDIREGKIRFEVEADWLKEQRASESDVRLYRYSGGWQELSTRLVSRNGGTYLYEARTPGFSIFAIAVRSAPAAYLPTGEEEEVAVATAETRPVDVTFSGAYLLLIPPIVLLGLLYLYKTGMLTLPTWLRFGRGRMQGPDFQTLVVYARKYKHHGRDVLAHTLIHRDGYHPDIVHAALDEAFSSLSERP